MSTRPRLQLQEYTRRISGQLATAGWSPGGLSPAAGSIPLTRRRRGCLLCPIGTECGRSPATPCTNTRGRCTTRRRCTTTGRCATSGRCTTSGTTSIRRSPVAVTAIRGAAQVIPTLIRAWVVVLVVGRTLGVPRLPFNPLRIVSTPCTETFLAGLPMVRTQTCVVDSCIVGCNRQVGD